MTNRFAGLCRECGSHVAAEGGHLDGRDDYGKWRVLCPDCAPGGGYPQAFRPDPRRVWAPPPPHWLDDPIIRARVEQLRRERERQAPAERPIPPCLRVLGLAPPTTADDIRRRFRELAKVRHPDAGGTEAAFKELKGAYDQALALAGGG